MSFQLLHWQHTDALHQVCRRRGTEKVNDGVEGKRGREGKGGRRKVKKERKLGEGVSESQTRGSGEGRQNEKEMKNSGLQKSP